MSRTYPYRPFLLIALVAIVALIASYLYVSWLEQKQTDTQTDQRGNYIVETIAPTLEYGLVIGSNELLREGLRPLFGQPGVVYAEIFDASNNLVLREETTDLLAGFDESGIKVFSAPILRREASIDLEPLASDGLQGGGNREIIGYMRVGLLGVETNPWNLSGQRNLLVMVGTACLLVLVLALMLGYRLRNSLSKVQQQLAAVESRINPSAERHKPSGVGFEALHQSLNVMNSSIVAYQKAQQQRIESLAKSRHRQDRRESDVRSYLSSYFSARASTDHSEVGSVSEAQIAELLIATASRQTSNPQWFSVTQLLKRSITKYSREFLGAGVAVRDYYSGDFLHWQIESNKALLADIFSAMLENVLITNEADELIVSANIERDMDDRLRLIVTFQDNRPPLSAAQQMRLFDIQYQPGPEQQRELALIIAKQKARLAGAELVLEYSNETGTSFRLSLIAQGRLPSNEILTATKPDLLPDDIGTLLLLCDDATMQIVIAGYLEKMAVAVDKCTSPAVAIQKLQNRNYPVIVCGCNELSSANRQFLRSARDEYPDSRLLLVVDQREFDGDNNAIDSLVDYVIANPLGYSQLFDALKKLSSAQTDS